MEDYKKKYENAVEKLREVLAPVEDGGFLNVEDQDLWHVV